MIELPLVFMAGILGTAHCLGMCGPLALTIGSGATGWLAALGRQVGYTGGRVFTYAVLGAAAGYVGGRLAHLLPALTNVPALLAIVAGLILVYQGLSAVGWFPARISGLMRAIALTKSPDAAGQRSYAPCLAGGLLGSLLRQRGFGGVFLAGVFTGFLPCGLLYGMLALAASTHSVLLGGATMVVFGLGTAPLMMLAGVGGRLLTLASRRRLFAAAAWCLVLTGVVSVARGVSFLSLPNQPAAGCPLCASNDTSLPPR